MSEGMTTTTTIVLGLSIAAVKAFALIILPAMLIAGGATALMMYLMQ